MSNKICTKCNTEKPIGDFYKHKAYRGGRHTWCKACQNSYHASYTRKKLYGVTIDQYDTMFAEQGGACAICGVHQDNLKRALSADHNHETGEIRALLCGKCNRGLGYFGDSVELLFKAIKYLESY